MKKYGFFSTGEVGEQMVRFAISVGANIVRAEVQTRMSTERRNGRARLWVKIAKNKRIAVREKAGLDGCTVTQKQAQVIVSICGLFD